MNSEIKKVMIFGVPASGKSTFAVKISKFLNLPLYHVDRYFFLSKWRLRNADEYLAIQNELIKNERWVIDGNAITSLEVRYAAADVVIYFHYNHWICLWRALKRLASRDPSIEDMPEGCQNTLSGRFLYTLWVFDKLVKERVLDLQKKYPQVRFYEFRKDEDADSFLKQLNEGGI